MSLITKDKVDALRALGLQPMADQREIRAAWKRLAFETHPDRDGGSEADFAKVRAAYDMLRREVSRPVSRARPRPSVETRLTEIPAPLRGQCRDALSGGEAPTVLWTTWLAALSNRETVHVPAVIRRRGRQLSYLVPTPLGKGVNRVALPTGELEDPRNISVRVLQFTHDRAGGGRIDIPETVVTELFPGARSVTLEFTGA
jgi:hypothetical protein